LPSLVETGCPRYLCAVISKTTARPFLVFAVALFFLPSLLLTAAESGVVRLRNEIINTPAKSQRATQKNQAESPHSGLFVIQFEGAVQAAWVEELKQRGVTLVQYVPDNAFVARGQGRALRELEELPFVRWTGPYRAAHKVHGGLENPNQKFFGASGDVAVSVLLASDAAPAELAAARGLMKKLSSESVTRFGRVWRGEIPRGQLNTLAASEAVLWIERAPKMKLNDETAAKIVGGDSGGHATVTQSLGYDGSGVVVSVADSGLHLGTAQDMHDDLFGRVDAFFWYGSSLSDASDEHSHGTHVAGIVAGNGATGELDDYGALWGLGVAPGAHIIAQRLFDGEGAYTPDGPFTFEQLTRDATTAGADIGSNSWGDDTQGRYDISAAEFDALVRDANNSLAGDQPYILEFSAGNAGPGAQTIGSPAVAKNVIATGASQNNRFDYFIYDAGQEAMADFSSRGPAEDGRIKPDVVAPGTWIASLRSPLGNDEFAWADISFNYLFQGGTSQAGPQVSGAAAVFVQWYRDQHNGATPSPAMVKAALINSAVDMDDSIETGPVPNNDEGWGRVDLTQIIGSDRVYDFVDQSVTLATGQQYERQIVVADETVPLFVTVTYTDVPGFPAAVPALVNDLDLEVLAPDGRVYRGNQFFNGDSIADAPAADSLNNVECVFIGEPLAGPYTIRVRARNVPQDARKDTGAVDQDFALVVSGSIPAPGTGLVFFDRRAYTVPGTIQVRVIDLDLQGQPSLNLNVRSTTQPAGVAVVLTPNGIPGTYTGSVATATTTMANRLRIAHNDTITTDYFDASVGVLRTATARGDLVPPNIAGVGTANSFGNTVVNWQTDEPANAIVRYSTNTALNLAVTNGFFTDDHTVALRNLLPGRTYFYVVISEDEAGNRATNNNGGALFSFVAATAPTVLLVENYQNDGFGFGPEIPLSAYTDTLNQLGVSYDVWNMVDDVSPMPPPTFNDLRPYRVVIWRLSDNVFINNTLSAAEQSAAQQYVQGGGSLFMSSMEQLTRLSSSFVSNVLQVTSLGVDTTVPAANGLLGNIVTGGGLGLSLDYGNYMTEVYELFGVPPDISDTMTVNANAFPILIDDYGDVVGLAYPKPGLDLPGRVVFLSFPLDAVSATDAAPNNRAALMQRVLNFLAPGRQGIGSITFNNTEFTLPSQVVVEVGDSDLAGAGQLTVAVASTSAPAGKTFTLSEFGQFGIFRGTFQLVSSYSANPANELLAASGDTVTATYFDASRGANVNFTAVVETVPPLISGRLVEPSYVDAFAYWNTSEPCDALVEYGESPFLGRTAYVPTLATSHEVVLQGLLPDRTYYYRLVSRDNAGNVAVDDNAGALYTFDTLAPLTAPWTDSLEAGSGNWSVYTTEDSELGWEYGVPNNGQPAHSGTRAWGSNLDGEPSGFVESFLISPAIYLTGGNQATLRFWQNFEFYENEEDFIHLGEVAIITQNSEQPITLDVLEGFASDGWEEAEYDLSPYSGQLVYLVWHYVFFSFDGGERPGWLIDDISVTVDNLPVGTLIVTSTLAQATFTIEGPQNLVGQGTSLIVTNAVAGQYTVTFGPVPNWNTPAPVINTVAAGGTYTFKGSYSITDANTNGLADSWEQTYFGTVAPSHPGNMDSDLDGMTDLGEFLAGTNPTNAASRLQFTTPVSQNTGVVRLDWPTVPGRAYRLNRSADLQAWTPVTDWYRANGSVYSFTTNVTSGTYFYRVEVKP
jgi:hypothetical protein